MTVTYASIFKRLIAAIIDTAFVAVVYLLVGVIPFFPFVLWPLIVLYYHVAFETSALRGTPGKVIMKIALVTLDGDKVTAKDSIVRFCASFISSFLLGAGYLLALFSDKKQTFHDTVAKTVVIDGVFSDENMWDIFVNQSKMYYKLLTNKTNALKTVKQEKLTIEELFDLYQKGMITEEEYTQKKTEILNRI